MKNEANAAAIIKDAVNFFLSSRAVWYIAKTCALRSLFPFECAGWSKKCALRSISAFECAGWSKKCALRFISAFECASWSKKCALKSKILFEASHNKKTDGRVTPPSPVVSFVISFWSKYLLLGKQSQTRELLKACRQCHQHLLQL